ncbi:MAG: glycoside hydrolase family 3 C-terminal domain-containing protein [Oscillospiraceae bacterium]|nr:glycoside hydrolase family 3 C-terminal domain-containing protein [Oscillospiraceae bacterium]
MGKWKKLTGRVIQGVVDRAMGNGLMQAENSPAQSYYQNEQIIPLLRKAGAESAVLLKNDGVLPLKPQEEVAVFGRCQLDWFYVGYGSGGDVKAPYYVNLIDGLRNDGVRLNEGLLSLYRSWTGSEAHKADHGWWGHWPMHHPEMPLTAEQVNAAARSADLALVVLGRAAGEDRENRLEQGSYYLTDEETDMLRRVTAAFSRVVVLLNIGNLMDMSWVEVFGDRVSAILALWQCGMESGNAAADVLTGRVNPCGRLADTIARRYADYPSSANFGGEKYNNYAEGVFVGYRHFFTRAPGRVLYPFGFGLSYTEFRVRPSELRVEEGFAELKVSVTNSGSRPGREVVQLWCAPPRAGLPKPARVLCAFAKTRELAPGETESLLLRCESKCYASYDEKLRGFVLDPGVYAFSVNGVPAGSLRLRRRWPLERCTPFCRSSGALRRRILERLPREVPAGKDLGLRFEAVRAGRCSVDAFLSQLSDRELEALCRGEGMMNSSLGTPGNAGVFGGVIPSLREKGLRPIVCADGPAGLRLQSGASLLPCGTALACSFDTRLVEELYAQVGREMAHHGVDVLLAPGMNLHRNPLCGRNFEYYSEDPLLSGKMAAAAVRGIQREGRAACPKHFACNNQETRRNTNDSRLSQRALRELYLRSFEICVREGKPKCLMTSYNKVNGIWSHYNYDLVTTVLRGDWGFDGVVMTDWWMRRARSPEFPRIRDNAYRVRAQVDVLMPGDMGHTARRYRPDASLLESLGKDGGITRAELRRSAGNVLRLLLRLPE